MIRPISMTSYILGIAYSMFPQYFKNWTDIPDGKTLVSAINPLVQNLKEFDGFSIQIIEKNKNKKHCK